MEPINIVSLFPRVQRYTYLKILSNNTMPGFWGCILLPNYCLVHFMLSVSTYTSLLCRRKLYLKSVYGNN